MLLVPAPIVFVMGVIRAHQNRKGKEEEEEEKEEEDTVKPWWFLISVG